MKAAATSTPDAAMLGTSRCGRVQEPILQMDIQSIDQILIRGFPKCRGTPQSSSILMWFSVTKTIHFGDPLFMETHYHPFLTIINHIINHIYPYISHLWNHPYIYIYVYICIYIYISHYIPLYHESPQSHYIPLYPHYISFMVIP